MSTSYTPTSNWTDRDLKGRDLKAKPVRPAEPISFTSDPATERLSRRMAEDVRPALGEQTVREADDDFMNRPMVNTSADGAVVDGPDIFDAPMITETVADAHADDSVLDAPMIGAPRARAEDGRPLVTAGIASTMDLDRRLGEGRHEDLVPAYVAAPKREGVSPLLMVGGALGVVAVAAVGWLALSGGEPSTPVEAGPSLQAGPAAPPADPLINMPVSETGAVETAALTPEVAASAPPARPARVEPVRDRPVRAEAAPAESAPATAIIAPTEPATPTMSLEAAPEPVVEAPAPLIATEPLSPQ